MQKRAIHGKGWLRGWLVLALLLLVSWSAQAQEWVYRVRPGDTLWDVAGAYLKPSIPWQRLQEHNRIANPYQLPRLPVQNVEPVTIISGSDGRTGRLRTDFSSPHIRPYAFASG